MAPTSMAARRELGDELRRLRGNRRGAEVAGELGWSESKLSRIETARTGISEADLERLLSVLGVPARDRSRLRDMAGRGRARVWWAPYRSSVPDRYDEYVALEAEATAICEWEAQVIPGLLQTDEYAHAVIEVGADVQDADTAQRRTALRMARQSILARVPSPRLCVVLDESALRREVGGRGVLRRQLQHLYAAADRPGVELRILPFAAGAHAALGETFVVLEFDKRPPVVHSEDLVGGQLRTKPEEVQVYRDAFADLRSRALPVPASRELIARTGEDLLD
ncbi:helix-turn-helix transcriptional regulator [Couchioplanes caeruleus]|uniref:helix-turn-helix domain-containing protein n=1 Tax=Couchioplanes caeruleus TaxID=56438 RepID=UPI0020BF63F4|nr:helix-turn-helix transcriptional regulator [Couchioplanes caeruleus]UQU63919.1 helix-turn-helix transcriptional regulator [Couchioplanes caeruleus]